VAHRLDSVLDCDRVIVLEGGRLVEQGPPRHLLRETQSCFAAMYYAASRERQGQDEAKHVTKPSADPSDA
jgi:ABC-type glutathione transport system ATPase component